MSLLFLSPNDIADPWLAEFARQLPDLDVRVWPDMGDPADIRYALVWKPPPGVLRTLPRLEVIFSLGAGVDALLHDPELPDLPLVR
ncbi:MAG TPA: glyoxylate/hydroxypyruvate reductase A, partial [Arenibaculum sp.]|nr:glyoxylate/hydroxypyruvate reductase A [Arenibaculum sp.]